ncbi:MAG: hypothetical protein GEV28_35120 [Actinophytocola sp.]|uniref:hypothetical protein n=1 Tax=Actinophytocola sp. TaxID=1872138 RepID=UPI0013298050|nr:hypothetical protein [Actinophytocola sp.]MPZ85338.1 hypothetical protein [Actinophytocola sp.]
MIRRPSFLLAALPVRPSTTPVRGRTGTHIDPARWYWFEGNFAGYQQNRTDHQGPDATRPTSGVHRRLTRD